MVRGIVSPVLRAERILAITLADNLKARELRADGTYARVKPKPGAPVVRSQDEFQKLATEHASSLTMTPVVLPDEVSERRGPPYG